MNSFSPNMLKIYQTCPKKYYFKFVERVNVPMSFLKFEKGKKIHALANYYFQNVNISRIETALTENEKEVWQSLLNNPFFQKKHYKSEYQLSCKIGDFWVGGRLDAVVYDDDGYYILDYKTGAVPKNPEFDFQTMIYLLCLDARLASDVPISFVYIDLKNVKNHVISYNKTVKKDYEDRVIKACSAVCSDTAYRCAASACGLCEYSRICTKE